MAKYRKKPIVIEAEQWCNLNDVIYARIQPYLNDSNRICEKCHKEVVDHGWIQTLEGGHIVCPGDWIITGIQGEYYPCKPDIFEQTYESVE